MTYRSSWMTEELDAFRDPFRRFLAKDLAPHAERWRNQKMVDRSAWRALGAILLGTLAIFAVVIGVVATIWLAVWVGRSIL